MTLFRPGPPRKSVLLHLSLVLIWIALLAVTGSPVAMTWSELIMSRSSNLLGGLYHAPNIASLFAFCVWALVSFLFIFVRPRLDFVGKKRIRTILVILFPVSILPLLLCYHTITIASKSVPSELVEFLGPIRIRTFQALEAEAGIPARCDGMILKVMTASGSKANIWLGVWPWALPRSICQNPLLANPNPANSKRWN